MKPLRTRVARPTDQLAAVVAFYRDAVGMTELGGFEGHDGYDGVMLGWPESDLHLEFTSHVDGSPCPAPTADNLLVFYVQNRAAVDAFVERLREHGHMPVPSENPYWDKCSRTFEDPDGWRVVFVDSEALYRG